MRAILINPFARQITEVNVPITGTFMEAVSEIIAADTLAIDAAPPSTAMFVDQMGYLRERQAFWRHADQPIERNCAGRALLFGLAPDGKLAALPPEITVAVLASRIVWTDDVIERKIERMHILQTSAGNVPVVHRTVVWKKGAVHPAGSPVSGPDDAALYITATPAETPPAPALSGPAPSAAPALSIVPLWAIHETADNRYKVIEYEVTEAGLGEPLSMATVGNLDAARACIPAGMQKRDADADTADDTLVETWF